MSNARLTNLSDLLPTNVRDILSGTGREFVDRVGSSAIKKVVLEVLCGQNLRDHTEPLTRRRLSQISGALIAMFANGWVQHEDFSALLTGIAATEMAAKRKGKADAWPARWSLGLTDKLADNILRSDAEQLPKYLASFEEAIADSAGRCLEDCGPITMQLTLPDIGRSTKALCWTDIARLTTAIGCATLTIRGSDKSIYGKLFERLVLGTVLSILGFQYVKRNESASKKMVFWLSDSTEDRECDATAIINPGKVVRFDIGFIGRGNPEITKDKISRFSRKMEVGGERRSSKSIVIVDRLPKKGSTERSATRIGTEIVQMSNKFWPCELAKKLHKCDQRFRHVLLTAKESEMEAYLTEAIDSVNIEDFVGKLELAELKATNPEPDDNE